MASPDLGLGSTCEDEDMEEKCSLCKEKFEVPKVLSCLHVFCEECLKKQVQKNSFTSSSIECPDCAQETKLGIKGVSGLPLDYMTSNKLDMDAMENMQIICTSCKAKEKAVARCTECATFLCNNCVTAHQYMRCFENHKVVSFEDMKGTGDGSKTFHKPVTCMSHPEELVKFYCHTCHIPICNDCMVAEHKQPEHHYEKASDAESKQKEELKNLVAESQSKVKLCEDTSTNLQTYLSELQLQRDNAKSHIEETFQSYKVMLEKHKDQLLVELDTIHSDQELQVMETSHNVEKTIEKIDDACKFAERLLNQANAMEILSLKHVVGSQLLSLINNTPKLETSAHVRFDTDEKKFEDAVKETFGTISKPDSLLKRNDTPPSQKLSPLHSISSYESEGYSLPTGVISPDTTLTSLDVDLTNSLVVQYNLAQLAGMAEGNASQNASNSATSPMSFSDLLHTSEADMSARLNTINNLTALAKMGSVQMNDSKQPSYLNPSLFYVPSHYMVHPRPF